MSDTPKEACIRFRCAEQSEAILGVGQLPNSVIVLGYNALPNYVLSDPAEPSAGRFLEPNYCAPTGRRCMEIYDQFQKAGCGQESIRRSYVTQYDVETGEITATELSAGPGGAVALCAHDGSQNSTATGRRVLTAYADGVQIDGSLRVDGNHVVRFLGWRDGKALLGVAGLVLKATVELQ